MKITLNLSKETFGEFVKEENKGMFINLYDHTYLPYLKNIVEYAVDQRKYNKEVIELFQKLEKNRTFKKLGDELFQINFYARNYVNKLPVIRIEP